MDLDKFYREISYKNDLSVIHFFIFFGDLTLHFENKEAKHFFIFRGNIRCFIRFDARANFL